MSAWLSTPAGPPTPFSDPADPRYDLAELLANTPGRRWRRRGGHPPGQLDLGDGDGDGRDRVTARRALATAALATPIAEALRRPAASPS
ncbi:MAG: hypothetical protein IPF88_15410 [Candidatus Microthrix sp.]|nr:hypothetical protein [Candidatus Microthrix sp.]MBK6439916.1 hypothetical protein [Candidatus Microthrix sp.]